MEHFCKLRVHSTFLLSINSILNQKLTQKKKAYPFYIIINNPAPPPYLLTNEAATISLTNLDTPPEDGITNDITAW